MRTADNAIYGGISGTTDRRCTHQRNGVINGSRTVNRQCCTGGQGDSTRAEVAIT